MIKGPFTFWIKVKPFIVEKYEGEMEMAVF